MARNYQSAVAIVDDDPAVLDSMKFLIGLAGYDVGAYSSAMAFLEDREARPSCLILDQHMPQMTGLELAAQLRTEGRALPILLVTGAPSPAIIARAAELGIVKVLEKPPVEDDLMRFIETHK